MAALTAAIVGLAFWTWWFDYRRSSGAVTVPPSASASMHVHAPLTFGASENVDVTVGGRPRRLPGGPADLVVRRGS